MIISKNKTIIAVCGSDFPSASFFSKAGFKVLKVTTDPEIYKQADVILVKVARIENALTDIGRNMKKGALVIIASTIAPGTMEKVVKPTLENESGLYVNKDFLLANIGNCNQVIGGFNEKATQLTKKLYKNITKDKIEETTSIVAEITNVYEAAHQDIQTAFQNEMALFCEAMGANFWEVRRLTKNQSRSVIGSQLLVDGAKDNIELCLIPLAQRINDFMPKHIFHLLEDAFAESGKRLAESKVIILGYSEPLVELLDNSGAEVAIYNSVKALKGAHAVVVMSDAKEYKKIPINRLRKLMRRSKPIIIDSCDVISKTKAREAGFIYLGVGNIN